jgi:putative tricarboxylic transport membrane protein
MEKAAIFRLETLFVFVLLVLGIAIVVVSLGYGFGNLERPGPGLYPAFLGAAIAIFAFFLLIAEMRSGNSNPVLDRRGASTLILMSATFCLWIVAMPLLGYVVVTLLATMAFCKIMKLEGWWKPLAVSGGTALFIYLLFDYWMYVDLPRGILG